jgi:hypothetical protein
MVSMTRAEAKEVFDHVLNNVLDRGDSSPLKTSLIIEGISNIFDLLTITDDIIDGLVYEDPAEKKKFYSVTKGDKMLLRCFLAYHRYLESESGDFDYKLITQSNFDNFRISPAYRAIVHQPDPTPPPSVSSPPTTAPTTTLTSSHLSLYSPVAMFRRSIKKDPSLFPTLKDDKYHDVWHRSFNTQAVAQDVSEVLDETYIPETADDKALFSEKKKYIYAVLESKVLTDRGKAIIREHEHDFDAQQVYKKIKSYHLKSTKAKMESSAILSYITSTKLGDSTWNGTTEAFIINWQNQVRLYEKHVPPSDHFSAGQKRIMLQNAVNGIDELRQVKNTADHMGATTGKTLSYDEYITLLLSAASAYDDQFKLKKGKRHVLFHDIQDDYADPDDNVTFDPDANFDIDCPVSSIQAYATNFRSKPMARPNQSKVRMPSDKWFGLDAHSKAIWDRLDDKAKSIILGYTPPDQSRQGFSSSSKSPFGKPPPGQPHRGPHSKAQVNLHDISAYDFLIANMHQMATNDTDPDPDEVVPDVADPTLITDNETDVRLINAAKSGSNMPPGDIRRVMSKSSTRHANSTHIEYYVSKHEAIMAHSMSLIDRGANGGVAGDDVRVIFRTNRTVDIKGIDNHHVNNIGIGTVGGVVQTQHGPVVAIMHQYALLGKGSSIHSPSQLEWYKNEVNDKSIHVPGGLQRIVTLDGYIIPLSIKDGLARLDIRPHTDHEFDTLPHVFLTSELEWDPTVLDHDFHDASEWADAATSDHGNLLNSRYDEFGQYRHRVLVNHLAYFSRLDGTNFDDCIDQCVFLAHQSVIDPAVNCSSPTINKKDPDFLQLRPLFGWLSPDTIKKTFMHTTQYARLPTGTVLKRTFKSPHPALNVTRRNEPVACDIVYADTPAIDDGSIAAVIFVGTDTQVTDVYGIKTDKQFINTLEDNITQRGAPHKLISDSAQVIIGNKVQDVLRTLCIDSWQSEPHQQHQNAAERRYQTIKRAANRVLDRTGAPPYTWLLCLQYVCFLLNHTYNDNIKGVPLQHLTGDTPDISVLLRFHFWQKVYYKKVDGHFPSDSVEDVGHIVGISDHCGHALTYKVLNPSTMKVLHRSLIRPADPLDPNLRAESLGGESDEDVTNPVIHSRHDDMLHDDSKQPNTQDDTAPMVTPIINPEDLIGRTFLMDKQEDGQQFRARIVKLIEDHTSQLENNKDRIKILLSLNDDTREEVITYNQLLEYLAKDKDNDIVWKFKRIVSHQGPLTPNHPDYKGSMYNVMIEWENGETTNEPLQVIAKDDPVSCAIYAKENGLLDLPGWKQFKSIAKRQKKFTRMVNQAKLRSFNNAPKFKNGFEIPRTYEQAVLFDKRNGNTKWQDASALELSQINEYEVFIDSGHHTKAKIPSGYKKIRVHFVFDVKHDGRHKARLVADGHLTAVPLESVYSGVVSLRGFRLVLFLAELNELELWATDVGNAYLEAFTSEKVYIVAGPEFKELEGHVLIISKALYGLRSSGARWHDRFADCISELGFFPCKSEPDIWMRKNGNIYEYVAVYVDDLAIAMKNPKEFVDILENKHKFKTKGTGPISFHLGMDFTRDEDNTLCLSPTKYIEKLMKNYERMFGEPPKQIVTSPLEKGDHPEVDTSELLDAKGIQMYQSMIGALQWMVTIGRFDIITAVMTMSSFRAAPRKGHLDRLKRIYGYLAKMRHAGIRIRTEEPDYSDLPDLEHDWSKSVYGEITEILPHDAPEPLGKYVTLTHFVDANLMHDIVTGRSVTGILHLVNKTPMDWYSKKQATVETATYGSEFVAARICVEQIIDLRNTLRYLGVPIRSKSYMFGDNKSVVDSSMQVHAKLHKRHTMLSFHRVREAVASGMIGFYFIPGEINPADILSKHWGYAQIWSQLKALLFWKGDTGNIND